MANRVVDYCGFAVRFVGLGYLVAWPFTAPDALGPAARCARHVLLLPCHWPRFVHLTPGLHLLGMACAGVLAVDLALRAARRVKRARLARANTASMHTTRLSATLARAPLEPPLPKVKPRSQFGLRPSPRSRGDSGMSAPAAKPKAPAAQNR